MDRPSSSSRSSGSDGERTYEARYYRWFIYAVTASLLVLIGGAAIISFLEGKPQFTVTFLASLAFVYTFGLYTHHHAPYRITVSGNGFRAHTILGTRWEVGWDRVERMELLWSRWNKDQVEGVQVILVDGRKLTLVNRLNKFDELVAQLRTLRPELVRD